MCFVCVCVCMCVDVMAPVFWSLHYSSPDCSACHKWFYSLSGALSLCELLSLALLFFELLVILVLLCSDCLCQPRLNHYQPRTVSSHHFFSLLWIPAFTSYPSPDFSHVLSLHWTYPASTNPSLCMNKSLLNLPLCLPGFTS